MPIRISVKAPAYRYYTVKGDTLAEIEAAMKKNGPVDDGKRMAALTDTRFSFSSRWKARLTDRFTRNPTDHRASVRVRDLGITLSATITLPRLGSGKLSAPARKEWERYLGKVREHELEHVARFRKLMETVKAEMEQIEGSGIGRTPLEAVKLAMRDLQEMFAYTFGKKRIDDRVEAMHHAFDRKTDHGQRTGAKLDTRIR